MSIKSTASEVGTYVLGTIIILAMLAIWGLLVAGGVWVGEKILPWLMVLSPLLFGLNVVIFLPLALIPPARSFAGHGVFYSSYVFGATGWLMGLF
ncbi:MAG: hypothetical protein V3T31_01995, partial [candidate division Zixibacteria bacterium]